MKNDEVNTLLLPYPPSANRYWRNMRGRMVRSAEANAFRVIVGRKCMADSVKPLEGQIQVAIGLHPVTKKNGEASATRLDLDNCIKVVLDALNGHAYTDDKQIVRITAEVAGPLQDGGVSIAWAVV